VTAKTIPRHARTLERRRWVPRPGEGQLAGRRASGVSQPGLAGGRGGADPLAGPVAVTGRAVLGDRIRRPTAWCEMAACISRYEDPAALGEADIRARALAAGWRHDAVGRLVCPYCQRRGPGLWASSPAAPRDLPPARGPGQDTDRARAGRISAVWSALSAWYQDVRGGQDWRREWLRLLAALAVGGNGWNTPPPGPAASTPGRRPSGGPAGPSRPRHRAAAASPGTRSGDDHRRQPGRQRAQKHGHERAGAWLWRRMPSAHSTSPGPAAGGRTTAPRRSPNYGPRHSADQAVSGQPGGPGTPLPAIPCRYTHNARP
jgi:hypothetical protein